MKRFLSILSLVVFCAVFSRADDASFWKKVTWTTGDGVRMVGEYRPASRPGATTWVLLHGLGSVKGEWDVFSKKLAAQGNGILAYDARGHGESTWTVTGDALDYQAWRTAGPGSPWDSMVSDLASAVAMLRKRFEIPAARIAVGGASLGANVACVYASDHPEVPALLLLSPGMEYAGIATEAAFKKYASRPVFMAASPGDSYAYASVRQLASWRHDSACVVAEGAGTTHGIHMFNDHFDPALLAWMKSAGKK